MSFKPIDRRTFLRGAGITVALPFLEAMLPLRASAATPGAPQRFVAMYFANGCVWAGDVNNFKCEGSGTNWTFGRALQGPLGPYKNLITPVIGLRNEAYYYFRANLDPVIAHWAAAPTFLTGQPTDFAYRETALRLLGPGASIDQMIAAKTPNALKSLVMGPQLANGAAQDGYYVQEHMATQVSYSSQTTQPDRLDNSLRVFNFLFSGGGGMLPPTNQPGNQVAKKRKSIIDAVLDDTNALLKRVSNRDKQKVDEYLTGIRELEKGILAEIGSGSTTMSSNEGGSCTPTDPAYRADSDSKSGEAYVQRCKNMLDMLAIAFQCDLTRVSCFQINNENTEFDLKYYGPGGGGNHHNTGHYRSSPDGTGGTPVQERLDMMDFKNGFEAKQLGYLIQKLQSTSDAYGPIIENTLILYGCGSSDSASHTANNLPILLAGRGAGHNPGSILEATGVNHANLLAAIANKYGAGTKVGMSTGLLPGV